MNILLIGGCGFLGLNTAKELNKNHNIFILDPFYKDDIPFNGINLNLTQTESVISFLKENKINIIIHFASSLIPNSTFEQYQDDIKKIYLPTVSLLEYCSQEKIKFVYLSSGGTVYGNQKEIFNEHTKREPISYYGLSKLNFENTITFYHQMKGLEYLIVRPSNPYGHGQNLYGKQGLIAVIMGKILKNEPIEIWGDGTAVKDYIYIDDFVFYLSALINSNDCWNNIYNIGSGVGNSVNDVLKAFSDNGISLPEVKYINASKSDVKRMILDCTKLQEATKHKCISLKDGIANFYQELQNGCN